MVTPTSGRRLTTAATDTRENFHEFAISEPGGCPVTLPCKLLVSSCLFCLSALGLQAQDGQSDAFHSSDTVFCFAPGGAT